MVTVTDMTSRGVVSLLLQALKVLRTADYAPLIVFIAAPDLTHYEVNASSALQ